MMMDQCISLVEVTHKIDPGIYSILVFGGEVNQYNLKLK